MLAKILAKVSAFRHWLAEMIGAAPRGANRGIGFSLKATVGMIVIVLGMCFSVNALLKSQVPNRIGGTPTPLVRSVVVTPTYVWRSEECEISVSVCSDTAALHCSPYSCIH